ncbi:pyrimidine dimer DNA glycosylase/endonuclease V [Microbacterium sp. gxy059]|uniref:pyrimidine dimer DNA glycosylase/endonuclease V n=1 Tax=Microbacterium sp. gxy059 TaxID=2957199 RepID=UPI003D97D303
MRLWSVHPRYLDGSGLTACWREALLAQAVLSGRTRGYASHPQLTRFRTLDDPIGGVGSYLCGVADEADARGYRFDRARISRPGSLDARLPVADGQLRYEWGHLLAKLAARSPELRARWGDVDLPDPHPLFTCVAGGIAPWERPR